MMERQSASKCVPKFLVSYRQGPTSAIRRAMVGSAFLRWETALRIVFGSGMVVKPRRIHDENAFRRGRNRIGGLLAESCAIHDSELRGHPGPDGYQRRRRGG